MIATFDGLPFVRTGTPLPVTQAFSPSTIVAWIVYVWSGSIVSTPEVELEVDRDGGDVAVDGRCDDRAFRGPRRAADEGDDGEGLTGQLVGLAVRQRARHGTGDRCR